MCECVNSFGFLLFSPCISELPTLKFTLPRRCRSEKVSSTYKRKQMQAREEVEVATKGRKTGGKRAVVGKWADRKAAKISLPAEAGSGSAGTELGPSSKDRPLYALLLTPARVLYKKLAGETLCWYLCFLKHSSRVHASTNRN
jgi:hypothetical protein